MGMFGRGGTEDCGREVCIILSTFFTALFTVFGDGGNELIGINKEGEEHLGGLLKLWRTI